MVGIVCYKTKFVYTAVGKMSTKMFKIVSRSGSWGVLDELLYSTPYGPKDARVNSKLSSFFKFSLIYCSVYF